MRFSKKQAFQMFRLLFALSLLLLLVACTSREPEESEAPDLPDVPATVQAEVANQLAAVPTATPWPTHTPWPTGTPYPTHTPYPTGTAYPTHTPYPTATAYPTATPYPTYTPYPTPVAGDGPAPLPTYTPYPTPTPATVVIQQTPSAPAGSNRPEFDSYAALDSEGRVQRILQTHILGSSNCDSVAELIVELSRQQDIAILRMYDMRLILSGDTRIECVGTARWSRGENSQVHMFIENAREDGDDFFFYGYSFRDRGYE